MERTNTVVTRAEQKTLLDRIHVTRMKKLIFGSGYLNSDYMDPNIRVKTGLDGRIRNLKLKSVDIQPDPIHFENPNFFLYSTASPFSSPRMLPHITITYRLRSMKTPLSSSFPHKLHNHKLPFHLQQPSTTHYPFVQISTPPVVGMIASTLVCCIVCCVAIPHLV